MPIALANIRSELLPGLFDVRGSYDMIPRQWDKVFATHRSNLAVERSTQMAFTALPFLKDEGAATQFDNNAGERFQWAFVHLEVALGYAITRTAIDDNIFVGACTPDLDGDTYSPAVDDGFYVRINPLPVGTHTLHIHAEDGSGNSLDVTYTLNVLPVTTK